MIQLRFHPFFDSNSSSSSFFDGYLTHFLSFFTQKQTQKFSRFRLATIMKSLSIPDSFLPSSLPFVTGFREEIKLYKYQLKAINKMIQREENPQEFEDPEWQPFHGEEGPSWKNLVTKKISKKKPDMKTDVRGGILCEDMGTGKTAMCLGLILKTRGEKAKPPSTFRAEKPRRDDEGGVISLKKLCEMNIKEMIDVTREEVNIPDELKEEIEQLPTPFINHWKPIVSQRHEMEQTKVWISHATFIVVPAALLDQWHQELNKFVEDGKLKILILRKNTELDEKRAVDLCKYDVVLTSHTVLQRTTDPKKLIYKHRPMRCELTCRYPEDEEEIAAASQSSQESSDQILQNMENYNEANEEMREIHSNGDQNMMEEMNVNSGQQLLTNNNNGKEENQQTNAKKRVCIRCGFPNPLSALMQVYWKRIIVDEGHIIGSENTNQSNFATQFFAERRWVVSGTPTPGTSLDTELKYIHGHLWFLGASQKKCKFWTYNIERPFKNGSEEAYRLLSTLLSRVMVRNCKEDQKRDVVLPPCHVSTVKLKFTPREALRYNQTVATIKINGILTRYEGLDYMLSANNTKAASETLMNLRLACFEKEGFSPEERHVAQEAIMHDLELNQQLLNMSEQERAIEIEKNKKYLLTEDEIACLKRCNDLLELNAYLRPRKQKVDIEEQKLDFGGEDEDQDNEEYDHFGTKLEYVINKIRGLPQGCKTIVFSQEDDTLARILFAFDEAGIAAAEFHTEMTPSQRSSAVTTFNTSDNVNVILANTQLAAFGINLPKATQVILIEPFLDPSKEAQAIKRAHRIGQTKEVFVEKLVVEDTIEELILNYRSEQELQESKKIQEQKIKYCLTRVDFVPLDLSTVKIFKWSPVMQQPDLPQGARAMRAARMKNKKSLKKVSPVKSPTKKTAVTPKKRSSPERQEETTPRAKKIIVRFSGLPPNESDPITSP
eukprot:TRINITY_DN2363_c1_g1_i1.p1 TRINITY_DN2363_c1_g1~~TRINITY_DN2363_c1_g1_i1.p1  ORF type:complete len:947 (+),score=304.40 TRINITY_DN2363_c1_g1_i1:90-2930(+)